jgi:hypothetical protein
VDEVLNRVRDYLAALVREGFLSDAEIFEDGVLYADKEFGRTGLEKPIKRLTVQLSAAHRRQQATWEGPTDCDRIDLAFANLERRGILARQDYTFCFTYGRLAIREEIRKMKRRKPLGFVFYDAPAPRRACESGELCLQYGSVADTDEATAEVAKIIC